MRKFLALTAAPALLLAGTTGVAHAAGTHTIRESDTITLPPTANGVHGDASASFTDSGLQIKVNNDGSDGSSNYVVYRWATSKNLADVHKVDYDWTGSDSRPGIKYDVDADGDGTVDCELIGEQAYGGQEVWLNKTTDDFTGSDLHGKSIFGDGDEICADAAPNNADYGDTTATGYDQDGTLDEWAANLSEYPYFLTGEGGSDLARSNALVFQTSTPKVLAEGVGASGLVQSGTLSRVGLGDDNYVFAGPAAAPTVGHIVGTFALNRHIKTVGHRHGGRLLFTTNARSANSVPDEKVHWSVVANGRVVKSIVQGYGARSPLRVVNHNTHRRMNVSVYRDGVKVSSFSFAKAPR